MNIELTGNAGDFSRIALKRAAAGDLNAVKSVLKQRPDWINRIGPHGRTMLWEACHKGRTRLVRYLIERGADINSAGTYYTPYFLELTCYCIARHKGHQQVCDLLSQRGAKTGIHTYAFLGDLASVKRCVKRNRKLVSVGFPQTVMAEKGQPVDYVIVENDWATPLCYALKGGCLATCQFLIDQGSPIQGLEETLFDAADRNVALYKLLLQAGADAGKAPKVTADDGELYDLLITHAAQPASPTELSDQLVYLCRGDRGGNVEQVARLLSLGARIDHQDHKGKTALHRAAKAGFVETLQVLFRHGADPNIVDTKGESALFDAVRSTIKDATKQQHAVRTLLRKGANPRLQNRMGRSVVDVAKEMSTERAAQLVKLLTSQPRRHR